MLSTLTEDKKSDWKAHLGPIVHAYSATRHDTTGYYPYYLMFGREPRLAVAVIMNLWGHKQDEMSEVEYASKLKKQLEYAYELASSKQEKASRKQKKNYDTKVRGATPQVGDRVLVKNVGVKGKCKLKDKWEKDVYVILEQTNQDIPVYVLQRQNKTRPTRILHQNLNLQLFLPIDKPRRDTPKPTDPKQEEPTDTSEDLV
jgi:hypothetical protein